MIAWLVAVLISAVAAGPHPQIPRDGPQALPAGTASITGVVVTTSNEPARNARVTLNTDRIGAGRTTTTDENGRFEFAGLPAGRFRIQAFKGGFLTSTYGASRPGRPGVSIAVADGQHVTGIRLTLTRGAAVSGTLRDARGRPVPGVTVSALRLGYSYAGERRLAAEAMGSSAVTDDRGMYRAWGLRPGDYVVMAARAPSELAPTAGPGFEVLSEAAVTRGIAGGQTGTSPTAGFATVFHPGTTDVANAAILTLAVGDERAGVDLTMHYVRTTRVDGFVRRPDGTPASGMSLTLSRSGPSAELLAWGLGARPRETTLVAGGRFVFDGVEPGIYSLLAKTDALPTGAGVGAQMFAQAEFAVSEAPVNVALDSRPAMTVRGRLAFDGTSKPPDQFGGMQIFLVPRGSGGALNDGPNATLSANGAFQMTDVVPGEYRMELLFRTQWAGTWALRSVVANGRATVDAPLRITAGENVELVLVYRDRPTDLFGVLQAPSGTATSDYFIVVFPSDRSLWRPGSFRVRSTRPGSDGTYSVGNLLPGEYLLAALTDLDADDLHSGSFLETLSAKALKVTVLEGQRVKHDLRIDR
jgi:hypothetical protein